MSRPGAEEPFRARPKEVRQHRYWMFRFKTIEEKYSGARAAAIAAKEDPDLVEKEVVDDPEADKVRALYEDQPAFQFAGGWLTFGVKWDIDREDPAQIGVIVPLDKSLWEDWHKVCLENATELPVQEKPERIQIDRPDFRDHAEVDVDLSIE